MFLDGKAVLHIIDTVTRFLAATFLDTYGAKFGQSVEGIWLVFVMTWCNIYTEYLNKLKTDQGSVLTSVCWKQLPYVSDLQLRLSGVSAHSSRGIVERYHELLGRIHRKINFDHPRIHPPLILRVAINSSF